MLNSVDRARGNAWVTKGVLLLESSEKTSYRVKPLFKDAGYEFMRVLHSKLEDGSKETFTFEFKRQGFSDNPVWDHRATLALSMKDGKAASATITIKEPVDERIRSAPILHHIYEQHYTVDYLWQFNSANTSPAAALGELLDTMRNAAIVGIKSGDGTVPAWLKRYIYEVSTIADVVNDTLRPGITPVFGMGRRDNTGGMAGEACNGSP